MRLFVLYALLFFSLCQSTYSQNGRSPLKLKRKTLLDLYNENGFKKLIDSVSVSFSWKQLDSILIVTNSKEKTALQFYNSIIELRGNETNGGTKCKIDLSFVKCELIGIIDSVEFIDTVSINSCYYNLIIRNCKFNDLNMGYYENYTGDSINKLNIENSVINSGFIRHMGSGTIEFKENIIKNVLILLHGLTEFTFSDNVCEDIGLSSKAKQIILIDNQFKKSLFISHDLSADILFNDTLELFKMDLTGNFWDKEMALYFPLYDSDLVFNHKPSLDLLSNVNFIFLEYPDLTFWTYNPENKMNDKTFNQISRFFNEIQHYLTLTQNSNESLKSECIERINYQVSRYNLLYMRDIFIYDFDLSYSIPFLWQSLIFFTVNFGYHGELRFFLTVIIFCLLFSIIYHRKFKIEVDEFIAGSHEIKDKPVSSRVYHNAFIRYFYSLYFSFIVLVNPRFFTRYFLFESRLLTIVIIEWLIGILLMALFLIYIVSKYAFIKSLIGI